MKFNKSITPDRFYGYKHWTLETISRCFYVGKGRHGRPHSHGQRNHKWYAIVKRFGIRVEICMGPVTNDNACAWEISNILKEETFTTNHSHDDPTNIECNFTKGGDTGATGCIWTEERRMRQSLIMTGRKGHRQSEETRKKIGKASRERNVSSETRERNRLAAMRESLSEETRKKRSKSLSKHTYKLSLEKTLLTEFDSLKSAAASINGSSAKMSVAIKRNVTYKGFFWVYEFEKK